MEKQKRLVQGVGVNDSSRPVRQGGKICPYYNTWKSMIHRCYSENWQSKYPSYKGSSVCNEWLTFSSFRDWMIRQDWEGKQLDKDLMVPGNKHYCPDLCAFIPQEINKFLTRVSGFNSGKAIGMKLSRSGNYYDCYVRSPFTGKREHLGGFRSRDDAHDAWQSKKHQYACKYAETQKDERVVKALVNYFKQKSGEKG